MKPNKHFRISPELLFIEEGNLSEKYCKICDVHGMNFCSIELKVFPLISSCGTQSLHLSLCVLLGIARVTRMCRGPVVHTVLQRQIIQPAVFLRLSARVCGVKWVCPVILAITHWYSKQRPECSFAMWRHWKMKRSAPLLLWLCPPKGCSHWETRCPFLGWRQQLHHSVLYFRRRQKYDRVSPKWRLLHCAYTGFTECSTAQSDLTVCLSLSWSLDDLHCCAIQQPRVCSSCSGEGCFVCV